MPFDKEIFLRTQFRLRTLSVSVPELADFFGEDKAEWVVQQLTAQQVGRAAEKVALHQSRQLSEINSKLNSGKLDSLVTAAMKTFIVAFSQEEMPDDVVRRLEMLKSGTVSPEIDHQTCLMIAKNYSTIFYKLTNEIINLTAIGADKGELNASGRTQESDQPSD